MALIIALGALLASCSTPGTGGRGNGSTSLSQGVTATTVALAHVPYHTAIPGTCDKGGASWHFGSTMQGGGYTCTATALRLDTTNGPEAAMAFDGFRGTSFTQFDASVDVTFPIWDAIVGFILTDANGDYYTQLNGFRGTYWILRIPSSGQKNYLATTDFGTTTAIHMQIQRRPGTLKMTVTMLGGEGYMGNPLQVAAPETTTGLWLVLDCAVKTYADFSNFTFTPVGS